MQERPAWVRKNIDIDQRKLAIARVALGTSTEKATADAALDAIVFRKELRAGIGRLRKSTFLLLDWVASRTTDGRRS